MCAPSGVGAIGEPGGGKGNIDTAVRIGVVEQVIVGEVVDEQRP